MMEQEIKPITSFWAMSSPPRVTQSKVMEWIENLPPHIKYILCEIPVGGGKSPLALTTSGYLSQITGDAYILTPQKILQKQYENDFDESILHSLYGKANYTCESKGTNCEVGSDIKPSCPSCPHRVAFGKVATAPNVVLNYTLGLLLFKFIIDERVIRRRKLMVFDEAHTLENHLTEFNAISISEFRCKQLGTVAFKKITDLRKAIDWVRDVYVPGLVGKLKKLAPVVQEILERCADGGRSPSKDELQTISLQKDLAKHYESIMEQLLTPSYEEISENYVLVNEGHTLFKFKELYGKRNFAQFVKPMADKFLFMSSTILDKDAFCEDLGLDPSEAAFISMDSEFELDNRPVFYMPTTKMTYGWDTPERKRESDLMLKRIVELCNTMHPEESGIIHAGSFQISKWLCENLENKIPHTIMHHNQGFGLSRDKVIDQFQEQDGIPKLLISPSITEGLNLSGDKGRFAIFAKVPYPFLGDAWVKKRMSISDTWYKRQALIAMIQGGGRVVRNHDDWGHVYILDSSFAYLLSTSKRLIPEWWADSIQYL